MASKGVGISNALVRVVRSLDDLSTAGVDDMISAVARLAELHSKTHDAVLLELRRREWTYAQIGQAFGIDPSTAFDRVGRAAASAGVAVEVHPDETPGPV